MKSVPTTIAKVLKGAGLEPGLVRRKGITWKAFLKARWEVLAAMERLGGRLNYYFRLVA